MNDNDVSDLVKRAQRGERTAYGRLAEQFAPRLFALALRRLGNRTAALDLTQDALARGWFKIRQVRRPVAVGAWLGQVVVNGARNAIARRRPKERLPTEEESLATPMLGPLEHLALEEERAAVRCGLQRLRRADRETLVAHYFDGRSLAEMAAQFQAPLGTIKRRLHDARARLRRVLEHLEIRRRASC